MSKLWTDRAWEDYLYWQKQDRKTLSKINKLVEDALRRGHSGIGKPEALRGDLSGWWSRRIDDENRLVYRITGDSIEISQCRGHYRNA
ncbi:MAG: Txe/YoeB family addiction module toxin [Spirochaetaceae bacterium]|jgi:toxin YoeB|nr:Txe/YoeB family addiction module toxin [Spirochaetaceae bacterium]